MSDAVTDADVIVRREGHAGVLRLNRPKALNALTLEMTRTIARALDDFAADPDIALVLLEGAGDRGLCAGGDIVGLYNSAREKGELGKVFWREEYAVNAQIKSYPKPYVAFMAGLVIGGGVGLASHGRHRIVSETTKVSMPEVGLGFFPDVGGTWLLSRAPGEIGTYFGLTGLTMNGADALLAGFSDYYVPSQQWPHLRDALIELPSSAMSADVDATIARFAITPEIGPAGIHRGAIDALFAHDTIEAILAALAAESSDFAKAAYAALREKSPVGLKVTLKLLRQARGLQTLKEALVAEYRAALTVFESEEFIEGVRAAVIDKDRQPRWSPSRIEDVTPEIVARYFASRGADELQFPN